MNISNGFVAAVLFFAIFGSIPSQAEETVKCVELKPGRTFFLASGVIEGSNCAKLAGRDYWVHQVIEVNGEKIKFRNLFDNIEFEGKVGQFCGVASQDEAEVVTRRVIAECKAKKGIL